MRIVKLTQESKKTLLNDLLKRSPNNYGQYEKVVADIIADVRENGDSALFELAHKFDKNNITAADFKVTEAEIEEAFSLIEPEFVEVMKKAAANIVSYHQKQVRTSWIDTKPDGSILGQRITPLDSVGVYVPGGKAVYPSSVLMNVLPAKVAGVDRIVMCTPPGKDGKVYPSTLVAAKEAGVDEIYKVGGAQAIAAMAFGTESVPKVDKIVGPGNIYVALAKKAVFGYVSIDSIAGPSEILVLADETANPCYVAADLLSQAEHDEMASAILITTSQKLAEEVSAEIDQFVAELSRKEIIQKSLDNYGYILVADNMEEAIDTVNAIASEHMEIVTADPFHVMTKIRNAGAIFIGEYSSEPLGDYFAGPNHVLPTNGTAAITAAAATTDNPVRQGYINMTGTFWDTIVVCTITGLAIASSGVLGMTDAAGNMLTGSDVTIAAFETVLGSAGGWLVTIGITLFAFSTILGWEYHGEKAFEYLLGTHRFNMVYRLVFSFVVYFGCTQTLNLVWSFSDIANALMAIPNLICMLLLSGEIAKDIREFQKEIHKYN